MCHGFTFLADINVDEVSWITLKNYYEVRWIYYKLRQLSLLQSAMESYYKLRQLFYYKVRHGLLQIATGITKCDDYYKLRQCPYIDLTSSRKFRERTLMLLPFYMFPKVSARHWDSRAAFSCSISSKDNVKVDFHCRSRSLARRARFNFLRLRATFRYIACSLVYGKRV